MYLTYVTAYLNVCSMAEMKFPIFYIEWFLLMGILLADIYGTFEPNKLIVLYILLFTQLVVRYLIFMGEIIVQLCNYLNIRFLLVKPEESKKIN